MNASPSDDNPLLMEAQQAYHQGDFQSAANLYRQVLDTYNPSLYSIQHYIQILDYYGRSLLELCDFPTAQATYQTMHAFVLADTLDQASYLNGIGCVALECRDYDAVLQSLQPALALRERLLGTDHPDTIEVLQNIAVFWRRKGDLYQSKRLHEQALLRCERGIGDTHFITAVVCSNLAITLKDLPRQLALTQRAVAIAEQQLGPKHPQTAACLNMFATFLYAQGDFPAAQDLFERSLQIHQEQLGVDNLRTAYLFNNLGSVYQKTHNLDQAKYSFERALIIRARKLGIAHPDTLASINSLHAFYTKQLNPNQPKHMAILLPLTVLGYIKPFLVHYSADLAQLQPILDQMVEQLEQFHATPKLSAAQMRILEQAKQLQNQAEQEYTNHKFVKAQGLLQESIKQMQQAYQTPDLDLLEPLLQLLQVSKRVRKPANNTEITQTIEQIFTQHPASEHLASMIKYSIASMRRQNPSLDLNLLALLEEIIPYSMTYAVTITPDDVLFIKSSALDTLNYSFNLPMHDYSALQELPAWLEETLIGIDQIDWANLRQSYGSAKKTPVYLRLIVHDDEYMRGDAWNELYEQFYDEGTLSEAAFYAIPFLLRLLAEPRMDQKIDLLQLLNALVSIGLVGEHAQDTNLLAAKQAVDDHFEYLLALAEQPDSDVRAIIILCTFTDKADLIIPRLSALLNQRSFAHHHSQIRYSLQELTKQQP